MMEKRFTKLVWIWNSAIGTFALAATLSAAIVFGARVYSATRANPYATKSSITALRLSDFKEHLGLLYDLNAIRPADFGITNWAVGQFAEYQAYERFVHSGKSVSPPKAVSFQVIDSLTEKGATRFWLKVMGLAQDRGIPKDVFRLAEPADLRITPENRYYDFIRNYIPVNETTRNRPTVEPPRFARLRSEVIQTQAGKIECDYYITVDSGVFQLEVWVNRNVAPLGVVKVQTPGESMELVRYGTNANLDIPETIRPVLRGVSKLEYGCTSCHEMSSCHALITPPK